MSLMNQKNNKDKKKANKKNAANAKDSKFIVKPKAGFISKQANTGSQRGS